MSKVEVTQKWQAEQIAALPIRQKKDGSLGIWFVFKVFKSAMQGQKGFPGSCASFQMYTFPFQRPPDLLNEGYLFIIKCIQFQRRILIQ